MKSGSIEIVKLYKEGLTMKEVSERLGFSMGKIHKYLKLEGINKSVIKVVTESRENKHPLISTVSDLYKENYSIGEIHAKTLIPLSVIRNELVRNNIIRDRAQGIRVAASKGRMSKPVNQGRKFSDEVKESMSKGRLKWSAKHAKHKRINSSGYVEFTTGDKVGKLEHTWVMEQRIGRSILKDECVHHIDEDKLNNDINNLALMTRSGHSKHHILQRELRNIKTKRGTNGAFSK